MRRHPWLLFALLTGCGPSPDDTTTGATTTSPATTGETTASPTSAPDMTTSPPTSGATTADVTGTTGGAPFTTSGGASTGSTGGTTGTAACGPPCAETWIHDGDLYVDEEFDLATQRCLVEVRGVLTITSLPAVPLELGNLRKVEGSLDFGSLGPMTDLAGLECLAEIGGMLNLYELHELADLSALAGLERVFGIGMSENSLLADLSVFDGVAGLSRLHLQQMDALTKLPTPGPESELWSLRIEACPQLTDLDPLAGTPGKPGFELVLRDNAALTSVHGLASAAGGSLELTRLPALASLDGLVALDGSWILLESLPLIDDLDPLAGLTEIGILRIVDLPQLATLAPLAGTEAIGTLVLDDLPKLGSLAPLADLRHADTLVLGSCSETMGAEGVGLDAIVDLTPLEGLEQLLRLSIGRNDALVDLPALAGLEFPLMNAAVIANPSLPPAEIAAFAAAHPITCAEPPGDCTCPQDVPNP